jgi:glycosyltransferase involved in cell wall biosynthesis
MLLIQELSQTGIKQRLIVRQNSHLIQRLQDIPNLEIIAIPKPYIFSLPLIKDSAILHAHETKAAQFCLFAYLLYKKPYIITRRVDNPIKNNFFNRYIYLQSSCVVVLSNAIKDEVKKISSDINIQIIPSAYTKMEVDLDKVKAIKNRFEGKFLLGNIAQLDNRHKGQSYLIEVMRRLESNYPNIHLILVGGGEDEKILKNQAKELKNITFEGFVDNVADYIHSLDMFVFPSLNEGLGSILLDVIEAKVPIVASKVGGIVDIITDNKTGLLVLPKDIDGLHNAIVKLYLDKDLRDRLTQEGYKDIQNYSTKNMCSRYQGVYGNIYSS